MLTTTMKIIQIPLEVWGGFFTLIAAIATLFGYKNEPKRSLPLFFLLLLNTILLDSDALALAFSGNPTRLGYYMVRISNFVVFIMMPMLCAIAAIYLGALLDREKRAVNRRWLYAQHLLCVVHFSIIVISQFTGLIYTFDENNIYHRSSFFWIVPALGFTILISFATMIIYYHSLISKWECVSLLFFILLPLTSNIIQAFVYGFSLNNIAITLALMLVFLVHVAERSKRLYEQSNALMEQKLRISEMNKQLAENRIKLMTSQMRPHFIFNVLASIEHLCKYQPDMAAKATHQFSKYLRSNLNTLGSEGTIPFKEELEHIHTYIWLEQMRFGDAVWYDEDIQVTDFMLPSLTIQPLLENAIKHGYSGAEEGELHIFLSVTETPEEILITVEDDGDGFDPDVIPKDGRSHIGLGNVKERIQMVMNGRVDIQSNPGEGTVVTVHLPNDTHTPKKDAS